LTPDLFSDASVLQLPGLFGDLSEATLVHTALMNAVPLRGYEKFVTLGSFVNYPLMIHMRDPVASLADLRGKKVRANSLIEVSTLDALGIQSTVLPVNEIAIAIGRKTLDGTTMPPGSRVAYGISRITRYHYAASLGGAPLNFLMNRARFESLPRAAQDAIRKYSGRWTAARFIEAYNANNEAAMARFKADGARSVVEPSPADADTLRDAFNQVVGSWTASDARHAELLEILRMEIDKARAATTGEAPR
jgi:TRAP-type C4-dicarboxylate transport system substrate-binding protein